MLEARQGIVFVLSAPSGAGKSTLVEHLRLEFPEIIYSVSYTTRAPRGQEQSGRDYHFIGVERFLAMRQAGEFAEWAEVYDNFYGTAKEPVLGMLDRGRDVFFDIDVQGATQLRKVFPTAISIFILPPSIIELERRLRGRGTDTAKDIDKRLANARGEILASKNFDYLVVNNDFEQAYDELRAVYLAGRLQTTKRPELFKFLLEQNETCG